jgi:hypothetical protein
MYGHISLQQRMHLQLPANFLRMPLQDCSLRVGHVAATFLGDAARRVWGGGGVDPDPAQGVCATTLLLSGSISPVVFARGASPCLVCCVTLRCGMGYPVSQFAL